MDITGDFVSFFFFLVYVLIKGSARGSRNVIIVLAISCPAESGSLFCEFTSKLDVPISLSGREPIIGESGTLVLTAAATSFTISAVRLKDSSRKVKRQPFNELIREVEVR